MTPSSPPLSSVRTIGAEISKIRPIVVVSRNDWSPIGETLNFHASNCFRNFEFGECMCINLYDFLARSTENGPGTQAVIWVQGCTLGCPGCFNPATHDTGVRQLVSVEDLVAKTLMIPDIEGVTISGGEPFL